MVEWSKVSDILDEIRALESVLDVSLISRGGMYVMGDPPSGVHQETYGAMSAIIMGAAETTSSELKDSLYNIIICLAERNLVLANVGNRYMISIALLPDSDVGSAMSEARERITRLQKAL
jgi:predicted regulator of Ras-like GTPase activity (Roadblock/LC7/MglB family)